MKIWYYFRKYLFVMWFILIVYYILFYLYFPKPSIMTDLKEISFYVLTGGVISWIVGWFFSLGKVIWLGQMLLLISVLIIMTANALHWID